MPCVLALSLILGKIKWPSARIWFYSRAGVTLRKPAVGSGLFETILECQRGLIAENFPEKLFCRTGLCLGVTLLAWDDGVKHQGELSIGR